MITVVCAAITAVVDRTRRVIINADNCRLRSDYDELHRPFSLYYYASDFRRFGKRTVVGGERGRSKNATDTAGNARYVFPISWELEG